MSKGLKDKRKWRGRKGDRKVERQERRKTERWTRRKKWRKVWKKWKIRLNETPTATKTHREVQ